MDTANKIGPAFISGRYRYETSGAVDRETPHLTSWVMCNHALLIAQTATYPSIPFSHSISDPGYSTDLASFPHPHHPPCRPLDPRPLRLHQHSLLSSGRIQTHLAKRCEVHGGRWLQSVGGGPSVTTGPDMSGEEERMLVPWRPQCSPFPLRWIMRSSRCHRRPPPLLRRLLLSLTLKVWWNQIHLAGGVGTGQWALTGSFSMTWTTERATRILPVHPIWHNHLYTFVTWFSSDSYFVHYSRIVLFIVLDHSCAFLTSMMFMPLESTPTNKHHVLTV